ncbi:H-NS histone family protein [Delftia acidovorans]|uniref:H-NS histone family protein n=1 Tax=Delftia acidovorans TaxID=80866 RepID=UPI0018E7CCB4|nr:H-NS histone family protein [Delftia acidovorans]MBJ2139853.1 H-NS histone family protein [Delftia acidovorans]
MSDYQTLLAKRAQLDAQIAAARAAERTQAILQLRELTLQARALADEHGITTDELFPNSKAKKSASVGAPKYRDPATGVTWTGRGKPPNWINGKDREQYQI